tara:strand:+ start:27 stop:647 length:621 start_codon:yes stop_codon:yes gene_type:complete
VKNYNPNIKDITILVLVIIIIFLRSCSGDGGIVEPIVITKTEIKYDTITNEITNYVPKLVTRIVRKTDTVNQINIVKETDTITLHQAVDTSAILEDYFSTYVYSDVQDFDSLKFEITDTISQNKIVSRSIEYTLLYPTVTITNTHYINRREFYLGLGFAGSTQRLSFAGLQFNYKDKKRNLFGIGFGIDSDIQPVLSAQFLWKLGK